MSQQLVATISTKLPEVIRLQSSGFVSSLIMGCGFAYAQQKEKYWHFPIVFVAPSVYAGYHMFKNMIPALIKNQQQPIIISPKV